MRGLLLACLLVSATQGEQTVDRRTDEPAQASRSDQGDRAVFSEASVVQCLLSHLATRLGTL